MKNCLKTNKQPKKAFGIWFWAKYFFIFSFGFATNFDFSAFLT